MEAALRKIKRLQSSNMIINHQLLALYNPFISLCLQKMHNIPKDSFHPTRHLFELLPSGKCRSIKKKKSTTRVIYSSHPKAITILNTALTTPPQRELFKHTPTTSVWGVPLLTTLPFIHLTRRVTILKLQLRTDKVWLPDTHRCCSKPIQWI